MQIPCSRVQVVVADPGIRLARHAPGFMVWDEHGGTFVLRVEELAATEAAGESESAIILEIPLSLPERGQGCGSSSFLIGPNQASKNSPLHPGEGRGEGLRHLGRDCQDPHPADATLSQRERVRLHIP